MSGDGPPVIGLVGGIAAGKSTAAAILHDWGAPVLDADRLALEAYDDADVRAQVSEAFGADVFDDDGGLRRGVLAQRVFGNSKALARLNGILHPIVRKRILARLDELRRDPQPPPAVVLDVSLLLESPLAGECDEIWFLDAPDAVREERCRQRGWAEGERARREASQLPPVEKRARADRVLPSGDDRDDLREALRRAWRAVVGADPAPNEDPPGREPGRARKDEDV